MKRLNEVYAVTLPVAQMSEKERFTTGLPEEPEVVYFNYCIVEAKVMEETFNSINSLSFHMKYRTT